MPSPVIDIGPWKKGLVETIDPWDIPDQSLQELINLDVTDDGTLRCRRGFKYVSDTNNWLDPFGVAVPNNQPIQTNIWGDYETVSTNRFVFASSAGAVNGGKWLYTANPSAGWTVITDVISGAEVYASSVIYQNFCYVVATTYSGVGFAGGKKFPVSGFNNLGGTNNLGVSAANLPRGEEAYMIKERMFVVSYDESKIYWSKATDPVTWAAPDGGFVLVNPNDGGAGITGCILFRDILYIFKDTGIWTFSFGGDPALDGIVRKITDEFGGIPATDDTSIYFVNTQGCYILQNGVPVLLSQEVDWKKTLVGNQLIRTRDYSLIALPGQLIVTFGGGQEGYCLNTRTGAWSRYLFKPAAAVGMRGGRFTRSCRLQSGATYYVCGPFFSTGLYYFRADWNSPRDYLDNKVITIPRYRLKTKYISINERVSWKRLKKTWVDAYINAPSSAGGDNSLLGINLNTGFDNQTRTQVNEPAPGAITGRWFKLGNRRFLSLAFTLDSNTGLSYTPATGTQDTLIDAANPPTNPYWFIRRFATEISAREMQAV